MVQDPAQMLFVLADHVLQWATKLGVPMQPHAVNEVKQLLLQPMSTVSRTEALSALRSLLAGIEQPFALLLGKLRSVFQRSLSWHFGSHAGWNALLCQAFVCRATAGVLET